MENASKALIMAGGVILAMLVVALLMFAWSKFSEFYSSDDELREIENVAKFNEQFTSYDRTVSGYELVSLANKVADYNFRYSAAIDAKNDKKYNPIKLVVNLGNEEKRRKLSYDNEVRLFTLDRIEQSNIKNQVKQVLSIEGDINLSSDSATKVAKNYENINPRTAYTSYFPDETDYRNITGNRLKALKEVCLKNFNMNVKNSEKLESFDDLEQRFLNNASILKYYEYYQFKRAKFDCINLEYDNSQGRVKQIDFTFTGEIE